MDGLYNTESGRVFEPVSRSTTLVTINMLHDLLWAVDGWDVRLASREQQDRPLNVSSCIKPC